MTYGNFPVSLETLICGCYVYSFFCLVFVVKLLSVVQLFAIPWTVAHHASLPIGFPRQEYWSDELPLPPPGDLPGPEFESESTALVGRFFTIQSPGKSSFYFSFVLNCNKFKDGVSGRLILKKEKLG